MCVSVSLFVHIYVCVSLMYVSMHLFVYVCILGAALGVIP